MGEVVLFVVQRGNSMTTLINTIPALQTHDLSLEVYLILGQAATLFTVLKCVAYRLGWTSEVHFFHLSIRKRSALIIKL